MLEVNVIVQDKRWNKAVPKVEGLVKKVVQLAIKKAGKGDKKLGLAVVLTNDKSMQELNHTYRLKNHPTNVLSFPMQEKGELGDIVLGFETIKREAQEQQKTFVDHFSHMVVHGCLHLLGYDHMKEAEAAKMEALEIALLKQLNISNPYANQ